MINVKDEVYSAIKDITENVSDSYPATWEKLPAVMYVEEDNKVHEWTDDEEQTAYVRYKIDIWHNRSTSEWAIKVDAAMSSLGLVRSLCQDVADPSGLKHKVMRYEGIIDVHTKFVYHTNTN